MLCGTSHSRCGAARYSASSAQTAAARQPRSGFYPDSGSVITVLVSTHSMDEAERCHRLAYLAYGNLLVSGTAAEVVDSQALAGYEVTGPDLVRYASLLRGLPGIEQVTAFGSTLHVTGHDAGALSATAAREQKENTHRLHCRSR